MQTLDITFEKNYHTSLEDRFLMEKIIIHKSVDIGEDAQFVLDKAREEAELNHRRNNPNLYPQDGFDKIKKQYEERYGTEPITMTMEDQINSCTSPAVLKAVYEKLVKGKSELQQVYDLKLKELSHE